MTRFMRLILIASLAAALLAGCNMPAPVPAVKAPATLTELPPGATPELPFPFGTQPGITQGVSSPTPAPSETPAAPAALAETPTPFDYSTLPGWFAYMDYECKGMCTNVSIIRPDFLERKALTDHTSGQVTQLYWSRVGTQIAFTFLVAGENAHVELRMVSTKAGKEVKLVTLKPGAELGRVDWSPAGKHLVYATTPKDKTSQIFRVTVADRKTLNLSRGAAFTETDPDWSPDGKWIAFTSNRPVKSLPEGVRIWVMKTDGSSKKALLPTPAEEQQDWTALMPAWSPDGKEIAFYWMPPTNLNASAAIRPVKLGINAGGLWVMKADGKQPALLAACASLPREAPVWSPDGKKIAFSCGDDTRAGLVIANLEDTSLYQTEGSQGVDYSISWAPDGKAVVFLKKLADSERTINLFILGEETPSGESANTIFERVVWSPVDKLP